MQPAVYPEALAALRCPADGHGPLELEPGARTAADGAVLAGSLRCPACDARYAIQDGIADLLGPRVMPDSPTQLTNFLPVTAWGYERTWRPQALTMLSGEPFGYARELPLITRLAAPERGGLYLDVACSTGLYARALAGALGGASGHVVGIDHAPAMLRQARSFALARGRRISYVRAKAQALPFAPQAVAGAVMGGSLNEIGDAPQALREIRRVLSADGRCVLMNLVRAQGMPGRAVQHLLGLGGIDFWPLDDFNRLLRASGLRLASQWRYRVVVFSLLLPN